MNSHKVVAVASYVFIALAWLGTAPSAARVTVERSEKGAVIKADGQLYAEYLTQPRHQPCIWPILGPSGKAMTRAYPVGDAVEGESTDHPHHHSFWFTHGDVNGHDFWAGKDNRILHREFKALASGDDTAKIVTVNDWMHRDEKVCEDERIYEFGADRDRRWIDCTITLKATNGDVTFGDTKEGTFAIRVPDTMKVDAGDGGQITNREGLRGEKECWGIPSRWVDYSGPVEGERVGIAMMTHPKSFRPEVRWHVRAYGLFTANPFGQHDFPSQGIQQGEYRLPNGEELTLRYRVLFHRGDAIEGKVEEVYRDFAGKP